MTGHSSWLLGLFTLLVCFSCVTPWYTTDEYPTSRYPTREETTYWYPTTGYPDWTTRDDRYTTPEYTTPDWWETTTRDDRYTTPEYSTPGWWETTTSDDDRYTTPEYSTPGWWETTTRDDRYTTPEYSTPGWWETTTDDGGYTSHEPPTSEPPNGTVTRPRCPLGWTLYRDNCYIVTNGTTPYGERWREADRICRSMAPGGGLASIHDYSENSFVANIAQQSTTIMVWTGLFYDQQILPGRYPFKWQDGTYLDFDYWKSGFPINSPQYGCVYMDLYYDYSKWGNIPCGYTYNFVCKAPSSAEYLDLERDDYGCNSGFEGYGMNCYKFLPDEYVDTHYLGCHRFNEAENLSIKSADENDFVVERMNNLSRHQNPESFRLGGLQYDVDNGFYWDTYPTDVPYHNFDVEDLLTPMAHGSPSVYVDLSNGKWFIPDDPSRPMGYVCKKRKFT